MKYCNSCGKEIDDAVKFCPYCGAEQPADDAWQPPQDQGAQADQQAQQFQGTQYQDQQNQGQQAQQFQGSQYQNQQYQDPQYQNQQYQNQQYQNQQYQQYQNQQYQDPQYQNPQYQQYQQYQNQNAVRDSGSAGWGVLGFFIPIVGLILFLVWRKDKPKSAKVAGIGALIGFVLNLITLLWMNMSSGLV